MEARWKYSAIIVHNVQFVIYAYLLAKGSHMIRFMALRYLSIPSFEFELCTIYEHGESIRCIYVLNIGENPKTSQVTKRKAKTVYKR